MNGYPNGIRGKPLYNNVNRSHDITTRITENNQPILPNRVGNPAFALEEFLKTVAGFLSSGFRADAVIVSVRSILALNPDLNLVGFCIIWDRKELNDDGFSCFVGWTFGIISSRINEYSCKNEIAH